MEPGREHFGVDGFAPVDTVRALLNACTEIAFVLDTKGRFVAVNETCETWFGKTGAELMGRVALELIPPELAENRVKIIRMSSAPVPHGGSKMSTEEEFSTTISIL